MKSNRIFIISLIAPSWKTVSFNFSDISEISTNLFIKKCAYCFDFYDMDMVDSKTSRSSLSKSSSLFSIEARLLGMLEESWILIIFGDDSLERQLPIQWILMLINYIKCSHIRSKSIFFMAYLKLYDIFASIKSKELRIWKTRNAINNYIDIEVQLAK